MLGHGKKISKLEGKLGYVFKDKTLIKTALTHSSYGDGKRNIANFERLEFLGDRVLGLLTAETLYHATTVDEGGLARRLNSLVRKETCIKISKELGLGDSVLMSQSEQKQGGREKNSILGDVCESVLGALYLDGGYEEAFKFYNHFWKSEIKAVLEASSKDPKTLIQEKAAAYDKGLPLYTVLEKTGPDHRPHFVVELSVKGVGLALGEGSSKKKAERRAAISLLESWQI